MINLSFPKKICLLHFLWVKRKYLYEFHHNFLIFFSQIIENDITFFLNIVKFRKIEVFEENEIVVCWEWQIKFQACSAAAATRLSNKMHPLHQHLLKTLNRSVINTCESLNSNQVLLFFHLLSYPFLFPL